MCHLASSTCVAVVHDPARADLQQLAALQKEAGNNICCDCNAPSPQWASPKFGIFICLTCAGVHRGLGVHISFVRSISMDAFKANEIERMRLGGNENWRKFFEEHEDTQMRGMTWDDATIAERYSGEVGDEWKERLTSKVEGKDYVPGEKKPAAVTAPAAAAAKSRQGSSLSGTNSRSESPVPGKAKVDDKYFARLGADNASRPDGLPPSQGGKYGGFGNTPAPAQSSQAALPNLDDLQKDPVAALTKGFGWFTTTVTKTAKTVNDGYIQPTARGVSVLVLCFYFQDEMLTAALIFSWPRVTLPNKHSSPPRKLPARPNLPVKTPKTASTSLSKEGLTSAAGRRPLTRAARTFGTASPAWRTSSSSSVNRPTALLGRVRWEWGRAAGDRRRRRRHHRLRRMSGMTGEGGPKKRIKIWSTGVYGMEDMSIGIWHEHFFFTFSIFNCCNFMKEISQEQVSTVA